MLLQSVPMPHLSITSERISRFRTAELLSMNSYQFSLGPWNYVVQICLTIEITAIVVAWLLLDIHKSEDFHAGLNTGKSNIMN